jgi:hypothetical protein
LRGGENGGASGGISGSGGVESKEGINKNLTKVAKCDRSLFWDGEKDCRACLGPAFIGGY